MKVLQLRLLPLPEFSFRLRQAELPQELMALVVEVLVVTQALKSNFVSGIECDL